MQTFKARAAFDHINAVILWKSAQDVYGRKVCENIFALKDLARSLLLRACISKIFREGLLKIESS